MKYYPQIDTLRFFAVCMVSISHWMPNSWVEDSQISRIGVEIFFVISGFLITRILLNNNNKQGNIIGKLKTFIIRRALRIFPAYYFVVFLSYVFNSGHFKTAIWWNLAYGSNLYILKLDEFTGIMSHFWSLSVEEHFYLIWPIFIIALSRKQTIIPIILAILIGIISRYYFFVNDYSSIFPKIFTFSCFL